MARASTESSPNKMNAHDKPAKSRLMARLGPKLLASLVWDITICASINEPRGRRNASAVVPFDGQRRRHVV